MTTHVKNEDTVICDLRNPQGRGICIYATKIVLISEGGIKIQNEFNQNELVRLSLVINKKTGTSDSRISFIYINGIVSRAITWGASDNYLSNKEINFCW